MDGTTVGIVARRRTSWGSLTRATGVNFAANAESPDTPICWEIAMNRTSVLACRLFTLGVAVSISLVAPGRASSQSSTDSPPARPIGFTRPPTTKNLMTTLETALQQTKPREIFKRTVVIGDARPGQPNGQVYPFDVMATVHDYNPGNSMVGDLGKTCITKLAHVTFNMRRDKIGEWTVEPTSVSGAVCLNNPSSGVSAFPLDSIPGKRVGSSAPLPAVMTSTRTPWVPKVGEWACLLPGGRLAANMGFRMKVNKTYTDLEGARGGKYVFDFEAASITFRGGFLDGKGGKNVDGDGIVLSPTLTCAPWGVGRIP